MAMAKSFKLLAPVLLLLITFFLCYSIYASMTPSSSSSSSSSSFRGCLLVSIPSQLVFTHGSGSFNLQLQAYIRNPKFLTNTTTGRPLYLVTPTQAVHVQHAVKCGRRYEMPIRVRSGGHDYEGLSYRSVDGAADFAMLDLSLLHGVHVDVQARTAWVDSGATLGELYYAIGNATDVLAFPAGVCPTVGVGGHFTGGGFGMLMRKYGLSIDNIIDAELVDAEGRLMYKDTMGSDVFWAIRGGGGGSFGVVLRWQVRLVPVPATVTVFKVSVSASQGAVDVINRWQKVAPALPAELYIRVLLRKNTADFRSLYLGSCDKLLPVMSSRFPELGINRSDCKEMTWVRSVVYVYLGKGSTVEDLLNRTTSEFDMTHGFKATTDYIRQPIPRFVWADVFPKLNDASKGQIILVPYGARMDNVSDDATPYPHRAGVLYHMQVYNYWLMNSEDEIVQTKWVKDMYAFMAPYVRSESRPRGAYFNCRDLDLGLDWGPKYFEGNYERLTKAKALIDPHNYFRNEQSIPLPKEATHPAMMMQRPRALSSSL